MSSLASLGSNSCAPEEEDCGALFDFKQHYHGWMWCRARDYYTHAAHQRECARGREKESLFSAHIIMTAAGRQACDPYF